MATCSIAPAAMSLHYTAKAGVLALEIVSTTGTVTFDCTQTTVTIKSTGADVDTECTPTQLSFKADPQTIYKVKILFVFSDPFNGAGELREVCPGATDLLDVDPQFATPTLTIEVS